MIRFSFGHKARYNKLLKAYFIEEEAYEIAGGYKTFARSSSDKRDPASYIQRMIRSRRLYVDNLTKHGYSPEQIIKKIRNLYRKNNWLTADGQLDPWEMVKYYRGKSIDAGEYFPIARKRGKLKGMSISKGDVAGQRQRAKARRQAGLVLKTNRPLYSSVKQRNDSWIRQLRETLKRSDLSESQRSQFEKQIKNLQDYKE